MRAIDIGIFPLTAKTARIDALQAFAVALRQSEHKVTWVEEPGYRGCDLAIIYGSPGVGVGKRRAARQAIISRHRGPLLIVETPLFGRKVPLITRRRLPFLRASSSETFDRFRVALNGCFWDNGIFCNEPTDALRWDRLRHELGLECRDYRKAGDHILLVGQVPGDASLRGLDVVKWLESTVIDLSAWSDRRIVIRPHPLSGHAALSNLARSLRSRGMTNWEIRSGGTLSDALRNAWATITYSSGAAIDSLLMGVPALSMCPASMAWSVSDHELGKIEQPTLFDRRPWLDRLAHSQWATAEIADGTVWERFRAKIADMINPHT